MSRVTIKYALASFLFSYVISMNALAHEQIPVLDPKGDVYKTEGPNDDSIYGTTVGEKSMLMVYTHFPDVEKPQETTQQVADRMLGDGRFLDIFHKQSYGKIKLKIHHVHDWRVMPRPKEENDPATTNGHRQMFVDIFGLYPEINFHDYDYLVAKLPGRGNFAFGERKDEAIPYRDGFIFHAVNIASNSAEVLAHEVAHCMGLPDLYTYGNKIKPKNPVGAWDLMSSGSRACGFLGWHRHKLGWLDADRKTYLTEGSHQMDLTPLDAESGISMVVVPLDNPKQPSVVYVLEIGQPPIPKDGEKAWPAGVLVYRVDATKATGCNPVIVLTRKDLDAGATFLTDDKFQDAEAPFRMKVGEPLKGGGFQITVDIATPQKE
jgi:hypothetical protein